MKFSLALLVLFPLALSAQTTQLWYRQPAAQWREALPIGNGRLGAMVFGGANESPINGDSQDQATNTPVADGALTRPQDEHLQLNEDTVWQGERSNRLNPLAADAIVRMRALLFAGNPGDAEKLFATDVLSIPPRLPSYSTLGDLYLRSSNKGHVTAYRRQLDLSTGVVHITYICNGIRFTREIFASAVAHVLVIRLTADRPHAISFAANLDRPEDFALSMTSTGHLVLTQGPAHKGAIHFRAELQAIATGGNVHQSDGKLTLERADAVTLLLSAATDFKGGPFAGGDPAITTTANLAAASSLSYTALKQQAFVDHNTFFRRVTLRLTTTGADPFDVLPTDERLRRATGGQDDPGLAELYFQYGRYLLIASSRPGGLPANLQGLWASGIVNQWESKFTININTEMNYWLAESTNLSELHQPLFDLIDMLRTPGLGTGSQVAHDYYGAAGFVAHHNTDIWGDGVPVDSYHAGMWPMGAAWLSLHAWDHYDYTGDLTFLRTRAYPMLKGNVEFFLEYLTPDADGHLVTGPSLSPENRYLLPDGSIHTFAMGPTMDIEILRALFDRYIRAATLLGVDAPMVERVRNTVTKLPPFKIGSLGQLQEWSQDYPEAEPGHRHISHMWAFFPDDQISTARTPALAQALRVTLDRRLAAGGGQTGWSRAWVMNDWTRFHEGDKAYESLRVLLRQSTYPNLMDDCPPGPVFQIDGNLGGAAGIANMLLYSTDDSGVPDIEFLPALPKAWPAGQVSGLRTRGGGTVGLTWAGGKATSATLSATQDGFVLLHPPAGQQITDIVTRQKVRTFFDKQGNDAVSVKMSKGTTYRLIFK